MTLNRFLFTKIDNTPLLTFRIFFGLLIALESYGAIITGWVRRTLVEPEFTFTFIGFEWLQPLPGIGMYIYFFAMGTLGVSIALGYKYRFSIIAFTVLWTGVYLMQKSSYNNHYYLLILISLFMCVFPAHSGYSIDSRRNPSLKKDYMFAYVKWAIVLQLFIVYTFAAIAKLYGDWLDFNMVRILMLNKVDYPLIGSLLQEPWVHKIVSIFGILFDFLIIPALLWKPSRKIAFIASIFFHLFNSIVFQIGIFPYLSLAFTVFFFDSETIRKIFLKKKKPYLQNEVRLPSNRHTILIIGSIYFLVQLALPLRHHCFEDNVLWTEEGHRLSWRMMLRSRGGEIVFNIVDIKTGKENSVDLNDYLTQKQRRRIAAYPDFIWQFAQRLKKEYEEKGQEISVYVKSRISINGRPYKEFIDPNTNLANTPWQHFKHHDWIRPSNLD